MLLLKFVIGSSDVSKVWPYVYSEINKAGVIKEQWMILVVWATHNRISKAPIYSHLCGTKPQIKSEMPGAAGEYQMNYHPMAGWTVVKCR